ncbi:hypothetical protein ES319_A01G108100v1 [Gossypium barbadense]|uniref:Uncharacterized protein n=1 Tax=Gossypium barbadense TaxID=3634 RepID=A0A5J5WXC5_GOSBA|nr:hypothetical protein ES319_A01G108100v1 [Gossypium barbadense]
MVVEIMFKESIKPSCPTPYHLRTYKLSLLDQLMPSAHVPMIFFYSPINSDSNHMNIVGERLERLKQSLSETLTIFYPFAGTIKDGLYIDCNDNGVQYVEAKVSCCLSEILSNPDILMIRKLLPSNISRLVSSDAGIPVAMIQVNILKCGGIVIGTQTSHKIIDGPTSTTFLKAWAASARGSGENYLLPRDTMLAIWPSLLKFGKCVTSRFVFHASAIATLKAKASSSSVVPNPTSVESVSAFIWICFTTATRIRYGSRRPSVLSHIVNLRGKTATSLPEHSIGNLLWIATAQCDAEVNLELQSLVGLLRKSLMETSGEFVEELQGERGFQKVLKCLTDMCKVGIYEADFGWGKPMWVSPGGIDGLVFQNLVFLIETRNGDGIEALVTLDEQDMAVLQSQTEILSFAALDPSPFQPQY